LNPWNPKSVAAEDGDKVTGTFNICAFTVGDRLLWGGAEPLRRMLNSATGRL
jgi:hypothetical protein